MEQHRAKLVAMPDKFFDMLMYIPHLVTDKSGRSTHIQVGSVQHPQMFLSSTHSPDHLVQAMSPWLNATQQGMWPRQLPEAEETSCLGWLLFLAPEFDLKALRRKIQKATGVEVGMRFHLIHKGKSGHTHKTAPSIKSIHVEVDQTTQPSLCTCIANMYSCHMMEFPLGIIMCIVPEIHLASTPVERTKVDRLLALQEHFLAQTELHQV